MADEAGDEQRGHRVEQGIAPPDAHQRAEHRSGRQHVAARVLGVGAQHLALQPSPCAHLVRDDAQVDDERESHQGDAFGEDARRAAVDESIGGSGQHFDQDDDEEDEDAERGHRLVLAMAVRVLGVRRPSCDGDRRSARRHSRPSR